jgi:ParB/RepB/Spo0J family partition protein
MSYLENVPLAQLEAHPRNVRRELGDLKELADSIKGIGLLEPLVIAPKGKPGEGFLVIGGHRRLAAASLAGLDGVPCILRPDLCTPAAQIEAMLTENLQRSDLTVMEEADAYMQLELLGVTEVAIAKATGRSRGTIRQRLILANLPTARREQYEKGQLSLEGAVKCGRLREKWVDDAEILDMIDNAACYSFGGAYGIDARIERVLEERKRALEPEPDDEEDDDGLDLDGRQAERKERDRQMEAMRVARKEALERQYDWVSGRIVAKDKKFTAGLLAWAIDVMVDERGLETLTPLLGIDPPGEDEDVDDASLRIAAALKKLPIAEQMLALALHITQAHEGAPWDFEDHTRALIGLGYAPTDAERELLKDGE